MAITTEENNPTRGSNPARMEKLKTSGIKASATANPPKTSLRKRAGEENA